MHYRTQHLKKIHQHDLAAVMIDAQGGFTPLFNELQVPEGHLIVAPLKKILAKVDYRAITMDSHPEGATWETSKAEEVGAAHPGKLVNVDKWWMRHCVEGSAAWELISGLPAHDSGYYQSITYKGQEPDNHPYGGFFCDLQETRLANLTKDLRLHGRTVLLIGGLATDFCVLDSVLQARKLGFHVIVVLEACRGVAPETTAAAIATMEQAGAIIAPTEADVDRALEILDGRLAK
jgi:nicotinamidase/pyrazinamidase